MPALGRGGAGNIEAIAQTQATNTNTTTNEKISADLERNQQEAESYAGTAHPALQNQEYAHMGRGGAGNYYSPRALNATGEFAGAESSHVLGDGTPAPRGPEVKGQDGQQGEKIVRYGRGGAGNFFGVDEGAERRARKRLEEEGRKREELEREVQKGVDGALARPEKARLPGGEPY